LLYIKVQEKTKSKVKKRQSKLKSHATLGKNFINFIEKTSQYHNPSGTVYNGQCLLIQRYFCTVYDYAGKADLSEGCWNPKGKLWVATYFSTYF